MKVIAISGKAQHGKDTTAEILKSMLEEQGNSVLVTHYGDLVKYVCRTFFGWNGEKDEYGRSLLQHVGTNVVRTKDQDFWLNFVKDIIEFFPSEWDYVIIPDTRFPNEIDGLKNAGLDVTHLRISRPYFNSGLTEEQLAHPSETALDDRKPDWLICNFGTFEDLKNQVEIFLYRLERDL